MERRTAVAVLVALALLPACRNDSTQVVAADTPPATDHCTEVEDVPIQGEGHLVGQQEPPVDYNSVPPTSGWHTAGEIPIEVRDPDDPMREPEQVTALEMGAVVVSYGDLPQDQYRDLERLIQEQFEDRAALTSYERLQPGEVALTAWGRLQRCDAPDLAAVERFIDAFAQR